MPMAPFTSHITLQSLTPDDLETATAVVVASGLSTARDDLLLHAALDGVQVGAWREGRLVGVAGALRYGVVGVVGPMSVLPDQQGQGIGALLLRYALDWLHRQGARTVTLDATPAGAPLYRKHGFITDHYTVLLVRPQGPRRETAGCDEAHGGARPITPQDVAELARFDSPIFGASRHALLAHYAADGVHGVVLRRQGRIAGYAFRRTSRLGPFIAADRAGAATLIGALAWPVESVVTVALPEVNGDGVSLLAEWGFAESRRLERMRLGGTQHPGDPHDIYGITSFAFG